MKYCIIGIHKYRNNKTQTLKNVVGFGSVPIIRDVSICIHCGKRKIKSLLIATPINIVKDDSLDWI